MSARKTLVVSPPQEWMGAGVEFERSDCWHATCKHGPVVLVAVTLTDGSNLMMLSHPRGQASLRVPPDAWKIESHFTGRKPSYDAKVQRLWENTVKAAATGVDAAREKLAGHRRGR
jgi:hypothetical protein